MNWGRCPFDGQGKTRLTSKMKIPEKFSDRLVSSGDAQRDSNVSNTFFRQNAGANGNGSLECHSDDNIIFLEDLEDPQFSVLPLDSFDEVKCIMATPPHTTQTMTSTPAKKLNEFRSELEKVIQLDDLRKRMTIESEMNRQNSPVQIGNNSEAVISIPSPPKDPKDVVALIRRAKAIERLRELEKIQAALSQPKDTIKGDIKSSKAGKKVQRKVPTSPNSTATPPIMPTLENILQQISAIRMKTVGAKPVLSENKQDESEELDDFEVLEELYGAVKPNQGSCTPQSNSDLRKRINILQQQLLASPIVMEPTTEEQLNEFEAFERQYGVTPSVEHHTPQQFSNDLQDRISILKAALFQSPRREQNAIHEIPSILRYEGLQQHKEIMEAAAAARAGLATADFPQCYYSTNTVPLNTRFPKLAFPIEDLADADENTPLDDITMPDFDADISFDEFGIEDISSPDLCDVSISGHNMMLEQDFNRNMCVQEEYDDGKVAENVAAPEISEHPGILVSVVNGIVDRLKNMFSTTKAANAHNVAETEIELDSSLPNMFEETPPKESHMLNSSTAHSISEQQAALELLKTKDGFAIPPHPKDPKDYKAMIKRAQAIQRKQIEGTNNSASFSATPQMKNKKLAQRKMKGENLKVVCPAGEYSPSYIKAVARARSLAGLKNLSALLNPERAVKMAEQKAVKEAKQAALEALPPVERLSKIMKSMRRDIKDLSRPSAQTLATLPAIRANLPRSVRRIKPSEKKENWKQVSILSPILEEPELTADLIQFSPLKPNEARMRLNYLKHQLENVKKHPVEVEASPIRLTDKNKTPTISQKKLSPLRRAVDTTPKAAEQQSSTRQVSATNDEYGNVICHVKERTDLTRDEDDLDNIEPPDFTETLDMTPPRDPSIPTTYQIINAIRAKMKENVNNVLPANHYSPSHFSTSPELIVFPKDLPNEDLFDIKTPEFEITPSHVSPHLKSISPFEKDTRMYAWGEHPPATQTTEVAPTTSKPAKYIISTPTTTPAESIMCIPPQEADPKDYKAMIKRAQTIEQLRKQQDIKPPARQVQKNCRVLIRRRAVLPRKDVERMQKRVPKVLPNQFENQKRYDDEYLNALPTLPLKYREAVARARLLRGLTNKSAALNAALTAKISKEKADEEAAKAAYDALPEVEKLRIRIEKLRKHPSNKRPGPFAKIPQQEASLHDFETDTPKRSKRHDHRRLVHAFSPTPEKLPTNPQERFQRLKDAQKKTTVQSEYATEDLASPAIPSTVYSPIQLVSPSPGGWLAPEELPTSYFLAGENFDTPKRVVCDLENVPLDNLEYESEPAFADVSLQKSVFSTPSPITSRIISQLKQVNQHTTLKSPPMLKLPEGLPEEELFHQSEPSWKQTPLTTPQEKYKSSKFRHPMAWEEAALLATPENLTAHTSNPKANAALPQEEAFKPDSLIFIPPHPEDPKNYAATFQAIHKQKEAEEAATTQPPAKTRKNYRRPLALRKRVKESGKVKYEEKEWPAEPPPLPQKYRDAVAESRLLHGLQNKTEIAAKQASRQTYNELPKVEQIKTLMERLRKNPQRKRSFKPTIDQIGFLEALKQTNETPTALIPSKNTASVATTPLAHLEQISEDEARALAEFEALEAENVSQSQTQFNTWKTAQQAAQHVTPFNIKKLISDLRQQHLVTPPRTREVPVKTTDFHYTPLTLLASPASDECKKFAQQVTSQIATNEFLTDLDQAEDLQNIQEPTFLEVTSSPLMERPRPRDIIERVRVHHKNTYRPEVPTGHLLELRTPPRILPLPTEVPEENLTDMSYPSYEMTLQTPERVPVKSPDISIPQLFLPTPPTTPNRSFLSPQKSSTPSAKNAECCGELINQNRAIEQTVKESVSSKLPEQGADATSKQIQTPIRNHAKVLARMKELRARLDLLRGEPPLAADHNTAIHKMQIPDSGLHEIDLAAFENLSDLEELSKIEQPSCVAISDQYLSITPPPTPPPAPSAIIDRLLQQYYEKYPATSQENPITTPKVLEFPKELPEEQIIDLSAPHLAETPVIQQTPIRTPDLSMPQYFKESPLIAQSTSSKKSSPPIAAAVGKNLNPLPPRICPGIKIKTPQGQIIIPPHPKDSNDIVAMIKRAKLIQKMLSQEAADKAASSKLVKNGVPLSKKASNKIMSQKGSKKKLKKKKSKIEFTPPVVEHTIECSEVSSRDPAAGAHKLAALLQSKAAVKQSLMNETPPASYAPVMKAPGALLEKHKIEPAPSVRELTYKQHLINRQQKQQRKRIVSELKKELQQQQGWQFQSVKTPTPVQQRFKAIKSRLTAEATTSSSYPYSPVKTPEVIDLPPFQPLKLPQTPPFPYLENVSITNIADMSMQVDDLDINISEQGHQNEEVLEFELAEIANEAYEFVENIDVDELDKAKEGFNITERIKMLHEQLLQSSAEIEANMLE